MKSLKELFKIGNGPSSSHTIGPKMAAQQFLERNKDALRFKVSLYGSLALTGKGHFTDKAILDVLQPAAPTVIDWQPQTVLPFHTNGMTFRAEFSDKEPVEWTVYSVGGGSLAEAPDAKQKWLEEEREVYPFASMSEIMEWCDKNGRAFWEVVLEYEGEDIFSYLGNVWKTMKLSVERGLDKEGVLPGPIHLPRKASTYHTKASAYKPNLQSRGLVFSYALAVSEENAAGGIIVTAPTCGSCGVLPAVLYHAHKSHEFSEVKILRALATAGLFGNVVKRNASLSGAEVGCQGEIGVASAMAAAAVCQLFGGSNAQIEYAAEMGLEHHLGMTCDPVCGYVLIPCIERNAFAAARALDAELFALFSDGRHRVSFDRVVKVMKQTGHDIPSLYKETAEGGLAKEYFDA